MTNPSPEKQEAWPTSLDRNLASPAQQRGQVCLGMEHSTQYLWLRLNLGSVQEARGTRGLPMALTEVSTRILGSWSQGHRHSTLTPRRDVGGGGWGSFYSQTLQDKLLPKLGQPLITGRVLNPWRIIDPNLIKVMGLSLEKYAGKHTQMQCLAIYRPPEASS